MKKTFLSFLFTAVIMISVTTTIFADNQPLKGSTLINGSRVVTPFGHGVDY